MNEIDECTDQIPQENEANNELPFLKRKFRSDMSRYSRDKNNRITLIPLSEVDMNKPLLNTHPILKVHKRNGLIPIEVPHE